MANKDEPEKLNSSSERTSCAQEGLKSCLPTVFEEELMVQLRELKETIAKANFSLKILHQRLLTIKEDINILKR